MSILRHLHKRGWLLAALGERAPAGHSDPAAHVGVVPRGEADGLDGAAVLHVVLQRQDGHVIPLQGGGRIGISYTLTDIRTGKPSNSNTNKSCKRSE